jgi:hypothetical protein
VQGLVAKTAEGWRSGSCCVEERLALGLLPPVGGSLAEGILVETWCSDVVDSLEGFEDMIVGVGRWADRGRDMLISR